jgi:hypothetical protein
MWVIQEICLGGSKVPILCGENTITWEVFFGVISTLGKDNIAVIFACIDRERQMAGSTELVPFTLTERKLTSINNEHQKQAGNGPAQHMSMLDLARKSDASNHRDKVYGILGLLDPIVSSLVQLDYSHSVEEVYITFAQRYIEGCKSRDSRWAFLLTMLQRGVWKFSSSAG